MSHTLLDLPPNLTPAQLASTLQDRIRELNQILAGAVFTPSDEDIDLGGNAIKNLGDPQGDLDAVNFRTLKRFQSPGAAVAPPAATPGAVDFQAIWNAWGELCLEDVYVKGAGGLMAIDFLLFAVDETDINLGGQIGLALPADGVQVDIPNSYGSQADASGNIIATGPLGRKGLRIQVGDYLLIHEPGSLSEIVKVVKITAAAISIARGGLLGSTTALHSAGAVFYKLVQYACSVPVTISTFGMPAQLETNAGVAVTAQGVCPRFAFPVPNLCIAAIAAAARGSSGAGPVTVKNFDNVVIRNLTFAGNSPGVRTLNGAAYTELACSGALSAGQLADAPARVQTWHSLRNIFAHLVTPASVRPGAEVWLFYYDPSRSFAGLVQQMFLNAGDIVSSPTLPAGIQMPVGPLLQQWPPTIFQPYAMGANQRVKYPPQGASGNIQLAADGWFDLLVMSSDGNAADCIAVIQT